MKKHRKLSKWIISIALIVGILICLGVFSTLIKPGKIAGFEDAVTEISDITIPEGTRIVGLGEASHGNREFQQLKLEVFKHLVETTNIRAFILEGDMGGCALINEYIQGGEGTAEEMCQYLGYKIYRTDDMCALIQWMHDYNETAPENEKVRFYGNDIQYCTRTIRILKEGYKQISEEKYQEYSEKFDQHFGLEEDAYDPSKLDEHFEFTGSVKKDIADNREAYIKILGLAKFEIFEKAIDNLECYLNYRETEKFSAKYRDQKAKEHVDWALEIEEREHNGGLMLACHNDHMSRSLATAFTYLGVFLKEEYGDAYFAIGTDFYISTDNIRGSKGREIHKFCSDDPLAYQVKRLPGNQYYLDFSKVDPNSALGKKINGKTKMGSIGEKYSVMFKILKKCYQLEQVPSEKYNAMIYVYEASPIEVWEN